MDIQKTNTRSKMSSGGCKHKANRLRLKNAARSTKRNAATGSAIAHGLDMLTAAMDDSEAVASDVPQIAEEIQSRPNVTNRLPIGIEYPKLKLKFRLKTDCSPKRFKRLREYHSDPLYKYPFRFLYFMLSAFIVYLVDNFADALPDILGLLFVSIVVFLCISFWLFFIVKWKVVYNYKFHECNKAQYLVKYDMMPRDRALADMVYADPEIYYVKIVCCRTDATGLKVKQAKKGLLVSKVLLGECTYAIGMAKTFKEAQEGIDRTLSNTYHVNVPKDFTLRNLDYIGGTRSYALAVWQSFHAKSTKIDEFLNMGF